MFLLVQQSLKQRPVLPVVQNILTMSNFVVWTKITICISIRRSCSLKWISPPLFILFFQPSNPEMIIHLRSFFLTLEKSRRPKKTALHWRQRSKNYLQINKQLYTTCLYRCFEHKWNPIWKFPCLASSKDQAIYSFIRLAREMKTVLQNESLGRNLCKAHVSIPRYLTVQLDMDGERTQSAYRRLMVLRSICDWNNLFSLCSYWWRFWHSLPSISVNNSLHSARRFDVGFIDIYKLECWGWQTEIYLKKLAYLISLVLSGASRSSYITSFCRETLAILSFGCGGNYFSVFSLVFRSWISAVYCEALD